MYTRKTHKSKYSLPFSDAIRRPRKYFKHYCRQRSKLQKSLIGTVIIIGLVYIFCYSSALEIVRRKLGWCDAAFMTISILDSADDANFPSEHEPPVTHENGKQRTVSSQASPANSIIWRVDGFTKYIQHFGKPPGNELGRFEKLPSGKELNRTGSGFWVYNNSPSDDDHSEPTTISSIRASNIIGHVINSDGMVREQLEVAVAIRAYADGEATLTIRYQDNISNEVLREEIPQEVFQNQGFCFKILEIPFDKRIDMIHIQPTLTNYRRHGIVIVDQVIIIVAQRDVTRSFMHTFVSTNWCNS